MQPGIWTQFLNGMDLDEAIRTFARKDWRRLELSSEHGFRLLERGTPEEAGREFREFAGDLGVVFPQGHLWLMCDITRDDQGRIIEELKRWLDLYMGLGIRAAVLHPGGDELRESGASAREILDRQVRGLRALCGYLDGSEVVICLENCGQLADGLLEIVDAVASPHLGICLDTGHLNIIEGDQGEFVRKAGARLQALHIADNDGSHDQHLMPYARGTVAWEEVVGALREIGYAGLFNFEIPGENRCPIPARLAKLDYLKAILPVLLGDNA